MVYYANISRELRIPKEMEFGKSSWRHSDDQNNKGACFPIIHIEE